MSAELHTVVLYGICAAAVAVTAAMHRRPGEPAPSFLPVVKALWPFGLVGILETLNLNANGHLHVDWLLPGAVCLALLVYCRSAHVTRWTRRGLVLATVLLWLHGGWLLTKGYTTRRTALVPGRTIESAWYTPLTGLRRYVVIAGGKGPAPAERLKTDSRG